MSRDLRKRDRRRDSHFAEYERNCNGGCNLIPDRVRERGFSNFCQVDRDPCRRERVIRPRERLYISEDEPCRRDRRVIVQQSCQPPCYPCVNPCVNPCYPCVNPCVGPYGWNSAGYLPCNTCGFVGNCVGGFCGNGFCAGLGLVNTTCGLQNYVGPVGSNFAPCALGAPAVGAALLNDRPRLRNFWMSACGKPWDYDFTRNFDFNFRNFWGPSCMSFYNTLPGFGQIWNFCPQRREFVLI